MFKKIQTSLLISLIFASIATAQSAVTAQDKDSAQYIIDNFSYTSELGFTVIFPENMYDYTATQKTLDWEDYGTAESVEFGTADYPNLFNISTHEVEQWNQLGDYEGSTPSLINIANNKAFAYSITETQEEYSNEVAAIIDNITIHTSQLSDIENSASKKAIYYLYDKNIVAGYPDGTFKPEQTINRAELMKIITKGVGITPDSAVYNNCFPDVTDEWFANYVCYAKNKNWIQGYPDNTFKPEQEVNKVEAIKMIVNSQKLPIPGSVNEIIFDDIDNSAWYAPFMKTAKDNGLLEQTTGSYGVSESITRGEVSDNIYRSLLLSLYSDLEIEEDSNEEITEENPTTPATIEDFAIFISDSFNFSIEYPDQWYYAAKETDDENITRLYEFGPDLLDDIPGIIELEVRSGDSPDGTIIEMNEKTLVKIFDETTTSIYFKPENTRLYRVVGPSEYETTLIKMASTIEAITDEE